MKIVIVAMALSVLASGVGAQVPLEVTVKNAVMGAIGSSNVEKIKIETIAEGELTGKYNLIIWCFLPKVDYYNSSEALKDAHVVFPSICKRFSMDKTFDDIKTITVYARGKKQDRIALEITLLRSDVEIIDWKSATPSDIVEFARANGKYRPM